MVSSSSFSSYISSGYFRSFQPAETVKHIVKHIISHRSSKAIKCGESWNILVFSQIMFLTIIAWSIRNSMAGKTFTKNIASRNGWFVERGSTLVGLVECVLAPIRYNTDKIWYNTDKICRVILIRQIKPDISGNENKNVVTIYWDKRYQYQI